MMRFVQKLYSGDVVTHNGTQYLVVRQFIHGDVIDILNDLLAERSSIEDERGYAEFRIGEHLISRLIKDGFIVPAVMVELHVSEQFGAVFVSEQTIL